MSWWQLLASPPVLVGAGWAWCAVRDRWTARRAPTWLADVEAYANSAVR